MNAPARSLILLCLFALVACAQPPAAEPPAPPDTRAEDAAAIRAAIEAWSAAAQAKDLEQFLAVYADDAVVMLEGAPDLAGLQSIRDGLGGMMQDPNFALSFEPDAVVVARSADLAYETGGYSLTVSDPEQNPATQSGRYVVVWEKQEGGAWKVVIDAPISDPPPAAATD